MAASKPEDVERESLKDLKIIVGKAKEWDVKTVVIGGYAVRAFTNAYRHTKDIDMAVSREEKGNFTALLKGLGYGLRKTKFGLAASKKFDSDFIDVHISVGEIFDMSTGLSYPITPQMFREKKDMLVGSRYEANKDVETESPIVDLNTLLILKMIPKGRLEKDAIDIMSLIIDQEKKIDTKNIAKKCKEFKFTDHLRSQLQGYATQLNDGKLSRIWTSVTGTAMTGVQRRTIQKFFKKLDNELRTS